MSENRFSFKKELKNSISNDSNSGRNSINQIKINKKGNKGNKTNRLRYFDVYRQVKEEMLKNNNELKFIDCCYKKKKQETLDHLYLKNTSQINDYYKKNYNIIEIEGTKELEGINKKDLSLKVKKNQNDFIENMPLKYRNPELNKNRQKVNCTPIPFISNKESMYKFEKQELEKTKEKAVFIRKMEYTHAHPPPKSKEENIYFQDSTHLFLSRLFIIKKVKLIQKWYRFIKRNRNFIYKKEDKVNNKNNNKKNEKIRINNSSDIIDQNEESFSEHKNSNENNNQSLYDKNYYSLRKQLKKELEEKNKKNSVKKGTYSNKDISKNKNISFTILELKSRKNKDDTNIRINPINNCCYIEKDSMILLNNSEDMINLYIIQKKVKRFLKIKNQINQYKIYLQNNQNIIEKKDIKNNSNKLKEKNINEISNSEEIFIKNRPILQMSSLHSYDSIQNFTMNENKNISFDKLLEDNDNKENNSHLNLEKNHTQNNNNNLLQKSFENYFIMKNNSFNINSRDKNDKLRLLKKLLNKYNKKLNKEVENNCKIYYDKCEENNKIIKMSKNKLAMILVKITKNYLQKIFNDIYQYEGIIFKREKCLLNIFNNIISKLRRYFFIWSNRPLKLLIYKTKSTRYYNSLFVLKNNIQKLISTIYNIFIGKYFYIFIINYLYMNNIDIMNNKIFLFLKNENKLKLFYEISKNIPKNERKDNSINKLTLVEYFKEFENLNNKKLNLVEEKKEI